MSDLIINYDEIAQSIADLEQQKKELEVEIARRKTFLLEFLKTAGLQQMKTERYTVHRAERVTPKVIDVQELKAALDAQGIPYTLTEVFGEEMRPVFKELAETGTEIPGLSVTKTEYLSLRAKKE